MKTYPPLWWKWTGKSSTWKQETHLYSAWLCTNKDKLLCTITTSFSQEKKNKTTWVWSSTLLMCQLSLFIQNLLTVKLWSFCRLGSLKLEGVSGLGYCILHIDTTIHDTAINTNIKFSKVIFDRNNVFLCEKPTSRKVKSLLRSPLLLTYVKKLVGVEN